MPLVDVRLNMEKARGNSISTQILQNRKGIWNNLEFSGNDCHPLPAVRIKNRTAMKHSPQKEKITRTAQEET